MKAGRGLIDGRVAPGLSDICNLAALHGSKGMSKEMFDYWNESSALVPGRWKQGETPRFIYPLL